MNTAHKKPAPLYHAAYKPLCPVCGHVSYSPAGIHPQCAMRAADRLQIIRIQAGKAEKTKPVPARPRHYEKKCPGCQAIQHVRKQICSCGHSFVFKDADPRSQ